MQTAPIMQPDDGGTAQKLHTPRSKLQVSYVQQLETALNQSHDMYLWIWDMSLCAG